MNTINENMSVAEGVESCPNARRIFDRHGLKGCGGEHGPSESLSLLYGGTSGQRGRIDT
jgi:hypothetical protein